MYNSHIEHILTIRFTYHFKKIKVESPWKTSTQGRNLVEDFHGYGRGSSTKGSNFSFHMECTRFRKDRKRRNKGDRIDMTVLTETKKAAQG